jgi:hypothetical protein
VEIGGRLETSRSADVECGVSGQMDLRKMDGVAVCSV